MKLNDSDIIIYQTKDSAAKIEVYTENGTVWMTQAQMADLFQTTKQNIKEHIENAFAEGELDQDSVVREYPATATDGKNHHIKHYNLDVIISVENRVKVPRSGML